MEINTTKVVDNEVVKADDFDYGFKSFINNFALGTKLIMNNDNNFVIGGKVKKANAGGMNLAIEPIYSYCKDSALNVYQVAIKDEITDLITVSPADSQNRIDIIEVCGTLEEFDEQQRAINDAEIGIKTYPIITTKQRVKLTVNIKKGTPGSVSAPDTTEGWVKLAEIKVNANTTSIETENIYNITSDVPSVENEGWTNEKNATINIGTISEVNKRFRVEHNQDGTHKDKIIKSANIDFGSNTNQVKGADMPIGGNTVTFGAVSIPSTSKLNEVLGSMANQFNVLYEKYSKLGAFKFNGEVQIGSVLSEDKSGISKPLIIGSAGDGTAYFKVDNNQIFSITADKKLRMANDYSPSNDNDVVTKKTTDELNHRMTATELIVEQLDETVSNSKEYSNAVLSRYVYKGYVKVATTANINLSGKQTIDGVAVAIGDSVLVKNQIDKKQNGIWTVQSGAWNRTTGYAQGNESNLLFKLFYATVGNTQAGKFYYLPNDTISIGTTELQFIEGNFSSSNIGGKIVIRDKDGNFSAGTITATSFCGNVKGNVCGNVTGNVTGNLTGLASCATNNGSGCAFGDAATKSIYSLSAVGDSGWGTEANRTKLPNMSFIANWNGAYCGASSNLRYYCGGAFGTAAKCNADCFRSSTWTPTCVACAGQVMIGGAASTLGSAATCAATAFRACTWIPTCVKRAVTARNAESLIGNNFIDTDTASPVYMKCCGTGIYICNNTGDLILVTGYCLFWCNCYNVLSVNKSIKEIGMGCFIRPKTSAFVCACEACWACIYNCLVYRDYLQYIPIK